MDTFACAHCLFFHENFKTITYDGTPKQFIRAGESFSRVYKTNKPGTIEKLNQTYQVSSHEGSTLNKKVTQNSQTSRPAETDQYM